MKGQIVGKKRSEKEANDELHGLNKLLTDMKETKAKIAKQINADSIKEVKRALKVNINPDVCDVAVQILDKLCMFIQADPNANFAE